VNRFPGFLSQHAASLGKAAIAIISDTNSWDSTPPRSPTGCAGNVYAEVTLEGPSRDLHSGLYGGAVVNPLNALTGILGQLHGPDGRVRLRAFTTMLRSYRRKSGRPGQHFPSTRPPY